MTQIRPIRNTVVICGVMLLGFIALNFIRSQHEQGEKGDKKQPITPSTRLLCWVTTTKANLKSKTRYIKKTWGRRCDVLLFFASFEDKSFPTILLDAGVERHVLSKETHLALSYIYSNYQNKVDWILRAEDDSFVLVDNLKHHLGGLDSSSSLFLGFTYQSETSQVYNSGGAGYVLSQQALREYHKGVESNTCSSVVMKYEDEYIRKCMELLGVKLMSTLDDYGKTRFHGFHPLTQIDLSDQFVEDDSLKGVGHISKYPFTFHYLTGAEIRLLEFLVYNVGHVQQ